MSRMAALPAEITIYTAGALHREWREWLATVRDLPQAPRAAKAVVAAKSGRARRAAAVADDATWALDASGVGEIDAAGMQLLLALAQSLALRGRSLRLAQPSARLVQACEAIGLAALLATAETTGSEA